MMDQQAIQEFAAQQVANASFYLALDTGEGMVHLSDIGSGTPAEIATRVVAAVTQDVQDRGLVGSSSEQVYELQAIPQGTVPDTYRFTHVA